MQDATLQAVYITLQTEKHMQENLDHYVKGKISVGKLGNLSTEILFGMVSRNLGSLTHLMGVKTTK